MTDGPTPSELLREARSCEARGDWAGALACLLRIPITGQNAVALTRRRLQVADRAGDPDAAAAAARALGEIPEPVPEEVRKSLARHMVGRAETALRAGERDTALAAVEAAIALDPGNLRAHARRWNICEELGDGEGADDAGITVQRLLHARAERHPLAATGLRFFHPRWMTGRIGEIAHQLDMVVKAQRLG